MKLIECVANFSEGRRAQVIEAICRAIEHDNGARILNTHVGYDANRTVITFAGLPGPVVASAFRAIRTAVGLIDLSRQTGTHPRIGACDVCPLVPLRQMSMEEAVACSLELSEKVGRALGIPVFNYQFSSTDPVKRHLSSIRSGGLKGLSERVRRKEVLPDYGPAIIGAEAGVTVIGARKLLIAFNVSLNTRNLAIARKIAGLIREGSSSSYRLPAVRSIGWEATSYDCVQVSTNLEDYTETGLFAVFSSISTLAAEHGIAVKGSEIIGLVPLGALLERGLTDSPNLAWRDERAGIQDAVDALGLSVHGTFTPDDRVLEYVLEKSF